MFLQVSRSSVLNITTYKQLFSFCRTCRFPHLWPSSLVSVKSKEKLEDDLQAFHEKCFHENIRLSLSFHRLLRFEIRMNSVML